MKAVAYRTPGPIDREDALQDIPLEPLQADGRDLLVKITAWEMALDRLDVKRPTPRGGNICSVIGDAGKNVLEGF